MSIQAKIVKNPSTGLEEIQINLPFNSKGNESASGKSLVLATSNGNQSISLNNEVIKIGVNVFKSK